MPMAAVVTKISAADTTCVATSEVRVRLELVRMTPIEFAVLDSANTSAFWCNGDNASSINE
jgi:hypothetical protein